MRSCTQVFLQRWEASAAAACAQDRQVKQHLLPPALGLKSTGISDYQKPPPWQRAPPLKVMWTAKPSPPQAALQAAHLALQLARPALVAHLALLVVYLAPMWLREPTCPRVAPGVPRPAHAGPTGTASSPPAARPLRQGALCPQALALAPVGSS